MFFHPSQAMKAEEGCLWIVKVRIHIWLIWEGNLLFFGIFYETRFRHKGGRPEIDISVSKLLGFETFAIYLRVSVSVSENLVSEKKSRFRFRKIWSRKKKSK